MSLHFIRFVAVALLAFAVPAWATEVLVLNSAAVQVDATASRSRKGFEVENDGPNAIYCEVGGATPVLTKSRKLASGERWSAAAGFGQVVKCIAATADQVTGAATIYSEVQ